MTWEQSNSTYQFKDPYSIDEWIDIPEVDPDSIDLFKDTYSIGKWRETSEAGPERH